jgi:hypothetical protein
MLFLAGLTIVAPASSASPRNPSTVLGRDTTSESVKPRKPLVAAAAARTCTRGPTPKAR